MIISEQWLRDWVGVDLDAQGIADCLTAAGLEVDGVKKVAQPIDKLVVGRVLEVTKHPDADRLNLTKVDIGDEQLDIVCGASNVREDLIVAVATVGAKLPNGLKIKKVKVRGVESFGMLCSASELGLEEKSDGLIELDEDASIGQRVDEYLSLNESLIDIDLTPNRGDCLSVQGIARELKVLADGDYRPLDVLEHTAESVKTINVDLDDSTACPRYLARVIEGIDQSIQTPLWMQERLRRSNVRPISPIVDITNYVMLELGQPMHAFSLANITDGIVVRQSKKGEKITLLDESVAELDDDTLVIADNKGAIAIAGVMGGNDSAIDDQTIDIVLESAHFTRTAIAGRARRYGLHTESSHRFERGVDPQLPALAMERATELVLEICGGKAGVINDQSNPNGLTPKPAVTVRLSRLQSMLGMQLDKNEVAGILNRIADSVIVNDSGWNVSPPSYRFDIQCEADLVEEVARVKGYDNIPVVMPRIAPRSHTASESQVNIRQVKQTLVARDYREVINYSFIDPQANASFSDEEPIKLTNPLAENMSVMRTSLIPGLVATLKYNQNRQHERIRLFEVGSTYHKRNNRESNTNQTPYLEVPRLAGVITGPVSPVQWGSDSKVVDFYDLKCDLEAVLALTGQKKPIIFNEFQHVSLHPGQVSAVMIGSEEVGWLGRLHPVLQKQYGLSSNVFTFEVDLNKALSATLPEFKAVSRFPSVKRDLSIVLANDVSAAAITTVIQEELKTALVNVVIFDLYRGDGVAAEEQSVSLSMVLRDPSKTMTDDEAEQLTSRAISVLTKSFGARLR